MHNGRVALLRDVRLHHSFITSQNLGLAQQRVHQPVRGIDDLRQRLIDSWSVGQASSRQTLISGDLSKYNVRQKLLQQKIRFDKDIAKIKRCSFLDSQMLILNIDDMQIGSALNSEFNVIAHHFKMVRYRGTAASNT